MAQLQAEIKGNQGLAYQGLKRSLDKNFVLNGHDVYIKVVDGNGTAFAASVNFQTTLRKVHDAKIIKLADETGNAKTDVGIVLGAKGLVTVTGLNAYASTDVIVFVAIGSRV